MDQEQSLKPRVNIEYVDIDLIRPNPWNPKDSERSIKEFNSIKASIKKYGLNDVILVRDGNQDGKLGFYEIIDGEHRYKAAKEQGYKRIKINNLGNVKDAEARMLTEVRERARVPVNEDEEGKLLKSLMEDYDYSIDDILAVTPFPEDELLAEINKAGSGLPKIEGGNGEPTLTFKIKVSKDQLQVIREAINKLQQAEGEDVKDGRALELICGDFLGGT